MEVNEESLRKKGGGKKLQGWSKEKGCTQANYAIVGFL